MTEKGETIKKLEDKVNRIEKQGNTNQRVGVKGKPEFIDL